MSRIEEKCDGGRGDYGSLPHIPSPAAQSTKRHDDAWVLVRQLTARERQAVGLLVTGASNRIIAKRMGLSERTVKNHLQSAYRKLQVHSRSEAILKLVGWADRNPVDPTPPAASEAALDDLQGGPSRR
ncbi:LuxR C-terminal-related transcriptional regulator [Streptomyces sp. NPDC047017]|uniref:response regulator transcription factor n=1 Tax=Streptomyces sp. NPDC047017 TaxID=3155024 RepID=UPI0033E0E2F4